MHRGRGENRSACNDRGARRAWMRPFSAWQESRDLGSRGKREILNAGNLSRSESRNHLAAGKHSKILIIRRHDAEPAVVSRLDVIHFLATLQEIPRDSAETLGIQHISTKADVQGRAPAVLSSLQEKLQPNDTRGDFGLSYSCRISRWPAAVSYSLEWTGRGQKQLQNQAFAGRPSHLAASRIDGSNFPLQEAGMWDARTDQHQPNTGWWRRILFGGVAGIRVMSLKYPWLLLSELFSLPYFRRNGHQNSMDPVVETRRKWWRVPVKVATAISSRFCGSLSNPVVAAHFLLFIFELRDVIDSEFVEGDPRASQNPPLLKSILLEECKSCGSKSSVYASDMESDYFFEACSMSLPDLDQEPQTGPSSDSLERWESTCSDVPSIPGDDHTLTADTSWAFHDSQNSFDMDQLAEIQSAEAAPQTLHSADTGLKCNEEMTRDVATCAPHHFADHPTCISLRERRHEYGDQNYLTPDELKTSRWRKMVFWHGHCRQGNPSLYILLGKAVQQLPAAELQIISSVIISQMEYAELNFFRGSAKQMNIIMDLWGIGLTRIPPLEILSRVGMIMNRDYAGRGGCIMLINAPVMLSLVIGAIKRVILRPGYNKGALIAKGFLEKKDQILFFNRNYEHALEKHFDLTLLPSMFGGKCNSTFCPEDCDHGVQFLERL